MENKLFSVWITIAIVLDNGKQFDNATFDNFWSYYEVEHVCVAVA